MPFSLSNFQQGQGWDSPLTTFQKGKNPVPVVPMAPPVAGPAGGALPPPTGPTGFNINPTPHTGQGPYGLVPGPIQYPTTPYAEATKIAPGIVGLTPDVIAQIQSQVSGEFTPQEENNLWDVANRYGVQSGMPGAQLWSNKFMGNVVGARQDRIQKGIQNYGAIVTELGKMGVDPALAAQIAAHNAQLAAAPDPKAAADEMFRKYLEAMALGRNQGLGGNPGGGFGGGYGGGGGIWNPGMGTTAAQRGFGPAPGPSATQPTPSPSAGTKPATMSSWTPTGADLFGDWGVPDLSYDSPWITDLPGSFGSPSLSYDSPWNLGSTTTVNPSLSYDSPAWGGFGFQPSTGYPPDFNDPSYYNQGSTPSGGNFLDSLVGGISNFFPEEDYWWYPPAETTNAPAYGGIGTDFAPVIPTYDEKPFGPIGTTDPWDEYFSEYGY